MKISSSNKPVQTLNNKVNRKQIILKHKLQRKEGVWSKDAKSLLIDSLLRGYVVNPIYTVNEDNTQYVIDGVQRLSTLTDYLTDKFSLSKKLLPIKIEDTEYIIAGKKFSKLDDTVKDELLSASIQVYEITEYTDKDVREMFRRLNSGKPLNTIQKMTPDMSDDVSNIISMLADHPLFEKLLTSAQLKSSTDISIIVEILMLCSIGTDYKLNSFKQNDRLAFIEYYNNNIDKGKIDNLIKGLDSLDSAMNEDVKITKTSISLICYAAYKVIRDKKSFSKLMVKINEFLETYESNTEYKQYCNNGTNSTENVQGRLSYWRNVVNELEK